VKDLDKKDKKILYELDINSRQSLSMIGKKVGLAKSIVAYRIKRLTNMGVIQSYYTVIDLYKLGFIAPRFHFVYQYINPDVQQEIIDYFVTNKYTFIVVSTYGPFDLSVLFGIRDMRKMFYIWQEIQKRFGSYFEKQSLAFYLNEIHFPPSYLIEEQRPHKHIIEIKSTTEHVELDRLEYQILQALSPNAQMKLVDLAKKLQVSSRQIGYRIKKLRQTGVIEGFRTEIDIKKLGYQDYKVYMFLREFNLRAKIIRFISSNPHLINIDTTTGESHLELEFHVKNTNHLHEIIQEISEHFPEAIRNYYIVNVKKIHKWLYLPQMI
jgi:DNA-binding Lrp family transcriptional regulator